MQKDILFIALFLHRLTEQIKNRNPILIEMAEVSFILSIIIRMHKINMNSHTYKMT